MNLGNSKRLIDERAKIVDTLPVIQLKRNDDYTSGRVVLYSVEEAVKYEVNKDYGEHRGQIETLESQVSNLTDLVGSLMLILTQNTALAESDITRLLPDFDLAFPVKK